MRKRGLPAPYPTGNARYTVNSLKGDKSSSFFCLLNRLIPFYTGATLTGFTLGGRKCRRTDLDFESFCFPPNATKRSCRIGVRIAIDLLRINIETRLRNGRPARLRLDGTLSICLSGNLCGTDHRFHRKRKDPDKLTS
tara:strand:- start:91 stop:504 length:414 start_codon:yes stop_codon:yes gene_type:complete